MRFERIDALVAVHGFSFQAWDDRYSKGVWAALGLTEGQVDTVRDLSSAGDLDMDPAMEYVLSTEWLPYVTGRTMSEAMATLEERLASLPSDQLHRESAWAGMVSRAIGDLAQAYRASKEYGDLQTNIPPALPETFAAALAAIAR